jgi:hypothetical protein
MVKTHHAVKGTVSDATAFRSLCGRSSGRVWRVDTIESGQNLGTAEEVNCLFCLRLLAAKRKLEAA